MTDVLNIFISPHHASLLLIRPLSPRLCDVYHRLVLILLCFCIKGSMIASAYSSFLGSIDMC